MLPLREEVLPDLLPVAVLLVDFAVVPVDFPFDEEDEPVEPLFAEPDELPEEPEPCEVVVLPELVEPLIPDDEDEEPLFWD